MNKHLGLLLIFLTFARLPKAFAYPEFIGYGYTSCVTCHFNTQGNGPLNDYGRALFAAEIASRSAFDEETSDDELGASSGFLGKKEMPWWLRPSFKYRGIWVAANPGSSENRKQFYVMQQDANLTFILDKNQKFVSNINLSLVDVPSGTGPRQVLLSREHYLRYQASKGVFVSVGMLDKVFGIRLIDHTAYSRAKLGINQYNSTIGTLTHGAVVQYNQPEREFTLHAFAGNMNEDQDIRTQGASFMSEFQIGEKTRPGFSVLSQSNKNFSQQAFAIHNKLGLSHGSSVLAEVGYQTRVDKSTGHDTKTDGTYAYAQSTMLLKRGYNLVSMIEYYKENAENRTPPDLFRWEFGFLVWPLPRLEFRVTAQDERTISADNGNKDVWALLGQVHISL